MLKLALVAALISLAASAGPPGCAAGPPDPPPDISAPIAAP